MFVNWRNMIDLDVPSALPSFLTLCISSFINVSQCSGLCIFDSISDEPIRSPLIAHLSRDIFFLCRALLLQSDEWRCMDVSSANTYVSTNADLDIVFFFILFVIDRQRSGSCVSSCRTHYYFNGDVRNFQGISFPRKNLVCKETVGEY